MKKVLVIFTLGWAGAFAAAESTEVLFVANIGSGSINRFDPMTGASFGSFGAGILGTPLGIAVDSAGTVYVSDVRNSVSMIRMFNGFTGTYLGQLGGTRTDYIGGLTIGPDGFLYGSTSSSTVGGTGGFVKINRTTGAQQYVPLPTSVNPTDIAYGVSSIFVVAQNHVVVVNPANLSFSTTSNPLPGPTFLHFDNNRSGWFQGGTGSQWGVGTPRSFIFNFSGTNLGIASGTSIGDMANGHDLMYASVRDSSGNSLIQRYDPINRTFLGTFGAQTGWNYGAMACYTAPEPMTMLAIGAGLVGLFGKRRRRRGQS